ncbi:hypothetical protein [Metabacillus arenae]|uniref:Uncharacterized protein n=1 Tax=Metabacillus arenae TaxID=2771434 RepID=A0A926NG16_9BACI|nr:hypothetical protein [Metabacillus arenae]MBD1380440.1 hypothetical protein [Metabacillus arenae]
MIEEIIYFSIMIFGYFLSLQWLSILMFLAFEWIFVDYLGIDIFENPETPFDKVGIFFMKLFFGSGIFLYLKLKKRKWIQRKLYMLIALILQGILSIIVYYIITLPLDFIFS